VSLSQKKKEKKRKKKKKMEIYAKYVGKANCPKLKSSPFLFSKGNGC
jgi:hypothetical protein